jgi:outer membrane protein assembly factor BamA
MKRAPFSRSWRRAAVRLVILATCLASLPAQSSAQEQAQGQGQGQGQAATGRLAEIRASGSQKFTAAQIVAAIRLQVGSPVGRGDFQQAADKLAKSGRFSSVEYRYGDTEAGVRVEFQVTDAPSLPVWFDNFPWFTDDQLIAALKSSVPLFDGTAPEGGSLLDDLCDALQLEIGKTGLHKAVSHSLVTLPGSDERVQRFRVDDDSLTLVSIEFGDALAENDRSLHSRLSDIVGGKYSRTALLLFELEQVRPVYLSQGFVRVKFGVPAAKVLGSSVSITVPIDPGPVFTWRAPAWSGATVFGPLDLATLIPLHEGEVADGMKIEQGWQAIRDAYGARGYLDVNLSPAPHFDEGSKAVSYAVEITEGPQYHMGKLVLTGLSPEGERRIREGWKIPPGAVFNRAVYDQFIASGIREAFSGMPFHYEKIGRFLQEDPKSATVDVLIDFQ